MAERYCRICRGWHDLNEPWPQACVGHYAPRTQSSIQVIKDIEPYRSVIDKSVIGGRKQHRDHLRAHGCIEVGNEKLNPHVPTAVGGLGHDIKQAMEQVRGR